MATSAVAREAVCALRRKIARIEGRLADRLDEPDAAGAPGADRTGAAGLDAMLGAALSQGGLTEVHGAGARDAGAAAGFALALASLAVKGNAPRRPLLWVADGRAIHEAGEPYAPGILHRFSIAPDALLFAATRRLEDALWIAEEAAALTALSAVLLEVRGAARKLDLTATRRLHHRAREAALPLLLLRQAGTPEPTAAPVRLLVAPAPAGGRHTLSGPLAGSIGPPAFRVTASRSRLHAPATLILEWNRDERVFLERHDPSVRPQDHGAVVSLPADGPHPARAAGAVVALRRRA